MAFTIKQLFRKPKETAPVTKPLTFPPTKEDDKRRNSYAYHTAIFKGKHTEAFNGEWTRRYDQVVLSNLPANIVSIAADMLFGEEVTLEFDLTVAEADKQRVLDIWERSDMHRKLYEASVDCMVMGDVVLVAERGEDGLAKIRPVPAMDWFPTLNPDDIRDALRHEIMYVREGGGKKFLRVIRHEKGTIFNELFVLQGKEVGKPASAADWAMLYPDGVPEPQIDTGIDDFVLVHVPNSRMSNEYNGRSDLAGIETLFETLDSRLTQEHAVLQRHSGPILGLPRDVFMSAEQKGIVGKRLGTMFPNQQGTITEEKLDVVSLGENGEKPEYVTWDGKLTDNHDYIDKLVQQIAIVSETAPQLLNSGDWGPNVSGRALKILLIRTLAKVNRKRLYWTPAIQEIIGIAEELEGATERTPFSVSWPDGLPQDVLEAIEVEERKIAMGIETKVGAAMAVDDIDEEAAKKKVDEAGKEQDVQRNNDALANATLGGNKGIQRLNPIQVNVGR